MTRAHAFCPECARPLAPGERIAADGERHAECARAREDFSRVSGCAAPAPLRFMTGPERAFLASVHPGAARRCGFGGFAMGEGAHWARLARARLAQIDGRRP